MDRQDQWNLNGEKLMAVTKKIPFDFVIDKLIDLDPLVKPMFGAWAVYVEEKIMLILRERNTHVSDNGIWVATNIEYHESLRKEIPLKNIEVFGPGETSWQVLQSIDDNFEKYAIFICELIINADPRIGRIPKKKRKIQL